MFWVILAIGLAIIAVTTGYLIAEIGRKRGH